MSKLREYLSGEAKDLVPHSISSCVTDALNVLDKAYGNPLRLFRYRREHFFSLGKQPKETDRGGVTVMVKWLRDIGVSMEGLLTLADKDSTCAKALFNAEEMSKFLDVFEGRALKKLPNVLEMENLDSKIGCQKLVNLEMKLRNLQTFEK